MAWSRPRRSCGRWSLGIVVAAALWPMAAVGQGADELASMIEQNLDGIAFRLDLRPYQAAQDLEAEGRRLELLEKETP